MRKITFNCSFSPYSCGLSKKTRIWFLKKAPCLTQTSDNSQVSALCPKDNAWCKCTAVCFLREERALLWPCPTASSQRTEKQANLQHNVATDISVMNSYVKNSYSLNFVFATLLTAHILFCSRLYSETEHTRPALTQPAVQ